jgi:hypothetical protein
MNPKTGKAAQKTASRGIPLAARTPKHSILECGDKASRQAVAAPLWSAVTSTAEDGRGTAFTGKR